MYEVQNRTVPTVVSGWVLARVTFPFPASPHFSQEGTNQLRVPSRSYNTAGAILWLAPNGITGTGTYRIT